MPELPEVEVVCRNLSEMIPKGNKIVEWTFFRPDLRFKIPQKKLRKLCLQPIIGISRRAKYILFEFSDVYIISHLGMTGAWRREKGFWLKNKHDHLCLKLENNQIFVYSDPRRFGFLEVVPKSKFSKRFEDLGVEPLNIETDFLELTKKFKQLKAPIKTALMNQKLVVGVGNIYASEILFASKVSPLKRASDLTNKHYDLIWEQTKKILNAAIKKGGSTIDNYQNSYGERGDFQNEFYVYGREYELCRICHNPIKQKSMAGRSTFWCPCCQK
jgi:formamidopyrimidine-DNA glycosylase